MQTLNVKTSLIYVPDKHKRASSEDDASLKASIKLEGLRDPVILVRQGRRYILADGYRRLKAVRRMSNTIKAIVHPGGPNPMTKASSLRLLTNHHRQDFMPSQRAHYLKILSEKYGISLEEIAFSCGVNMETLKYTWMAVADCSPEIKMMIDNGKLPIDAGRVLSTLKPAGQFSLVAKYREQAKVSLKEVEADVRSIHRRKPSLVARQLSRRRRRVARKTSKVAGGYVPKDLGAIQDKIADREREIQFMRREILQARPIIAGILKKGSLRLELPSETLKHFDVFAKEEAFDG